MKYIVSFTTSPTRINKIEPMINSILNQTKKPDLIILNLPKIFHRTNEEYNIPEFVSRHVHVNIIDIDYGPATKLVPTIKYLNDEKYDKEDTRIIYVDDDVRYPLQMIEAFDITILPADNSVWASSGFIYLNKDVYKLRKHCDIATIVEGFGGVCVKLNTFEEDFMNYINTYTSINKLNCRLSDDIILSNYYHKKHIQMKVCCYVGNYSLLDILNNKCFLKYGELSDALHRGADGLTTDNTRYYNVINILSKNKELYFKIHNSKPKSCLMFL